MQFRHILLAVLMAVVFGMGWVFAKSALWHFPPILLAAFRFGVTALCLVWFARPCGARWKELTLISLLAISVPYSMSYAGMQDLAVSTTVLLVQLEAPALILLGAVVLGERPSIQQFVGTVCAVVGVLLVVGDPNLAADLFPVALVVGSIITWAFGQIRIRRLGASGGVTLIAWVSAFATPQLLIGSALLEQDQITVIREAGLAEWSAVVYLGLVMTALGIGVWYYLIGRYPVSFVGPFLLLVPAISVLGGVILFGETLSLMALAGGAIIVSGVAFVVADRSQHKKMEAESA